MSAVALLTLLGVTLLARTQALDCQWGALQAVQNVSELPLEWTAGRKSCEQGEGCQDTAILIVNGPQVNLVLSKGCTLAEDQEARVTRHRAGPGLSITSYTRVCRHGDFCNDLSTSGPLWDLPPETVPGTVWCPLCLSKQGCPENAPQQLCPAGHEHCYRGVLKLRGAGIASNLRVQGCMPEPGCNLLNGTQEMGHVDVSESCAPESDALTCYRGSMIKLGQSHQEPAQWTTPGTETCDAGELCQETLLLIDAGHKSLLVGSKGCSQAGARTSQDVSIHSAQPGLLVASYARFCAADLCNQASNSSVLLDALPPPGGVFTTVNVWGCASSSPSSLLNWTRNFGIFSAHPMSSRDALAVTNGASSGPAGGRWSRLPCRGRLTGEKGRLAEGALRAAPEAVGKPPATLLC
ncbi:CD177 antigen [Lepus europaeus]|uniref:CD177 antigen n=1 Tax=Lepus europaeus TaxID=9983 RepID=UPI002B4AA874|nr:CD177 antigen [Lepus europaeus]